MVEFPAGFRSLEELGRTQSAQWHHAVDADGRHVALTIYASGPEAPDDRELSSRLERCGQLASSALAPLVARHVEAEERWVALAWPQGRAISSTKDGGPRPWRESVNLILMLLDHLATLHDQHFAHGAIEAWTVRVDEEERPALLGPAPATGSAQEDLRLTARLLLDLLESSERVGGDSTLTQEEISRWVPRAELFELVRTTRDGGADVPTTASELADQIRTAAEPPTDLPQSMPRRGSAAAHAQSALDLFATAMIGRRLGGYQVQTMLGKGGMGVVFKAWDPGLDRPLAIKMIREERAGGEEGKERFQREAQAASRINHPNLVTVYAVGEADGNPYLAMEFVEGRTLRRLLKEETLDWRTKVRWVADLLGGLAPLHDQGIFHRDIKPENVLVTPEGVPKLTDFGLAKLAARATLTQVGMPLGTVHYMSPEQVVGKDVAASTDVYSMAVVLYEMLVGRTPFQGTMHSVMYQIQSVDPEPIDPEEIGVPRALVEILERALLKDPTKRYSDAAAFRDALLELLDENATGAAAPPSRWVWIGLAVLIALAIGVVYEISTDTPRNRDLAVQLNELGVQAEEAGRIDEARARYRESIVADSGYAVAWNNLGVLALNDQELAEADSLFRRAAAADSSYAEAHFNRGVVLEQRGRGQEAEASYRKAIDANPSFGFAYNNLGFLMRDQQRLDEAGSTLEEGLQNTSPNDESVAFLKRTLGRVRHDQGRIDEAIRLWQEALDGLPESMHPELQELIRQARASENTGQR